jgi:hypothetical protein
MYRVEIRARLVVAEFDRSAPLLDTEVGGSVPQPTWLPRVEWQP